MEKLNSCERVMKQIKIALKNIKPNPWKKEINGGKLDEETVEKLMEGYAQTVFHENIMCRENKKGEYELIYGHHRLEAAKRVYGKDFEININAYSLAEFDDDKMIIDLIRENILQRGGEDFKNMTDCIMLTKKWMESKTKSKVSHVEIAKFLSKQGKAIRTDMVNKYLKIEDNLHPDLKRIVTKGDRGGVIEEGKIGLETALSLSSLDKKEQKSIYKQIESLNINKDKVRDFVNDYKCSPKKIQERIMNGKVRLDQLKDEISLHNYHEEYKKAKDAANGKSPGLRVLETKRILENLRGDIVEAERNFTRFINKMGSMKFNQINWKDNQQKQTFARFIRESVVKAEKWAKVLEVAERELV